MSMLLNCHFLCNSVLFDSSMVGHFTEALQFNLRFMQSAFSRQSQAQLHDELLDVKYIVREFCGHIK